MWQQYVNSSNIDDVLRILAEQREKARIVAGATDLLLEIERGVRKNIDVLVDITRLPGLDQIILDEDKQIHIGPLVTHNDCVASKLICEYAFPLAQAAWGVGSPQIRNRGTVAGNLITASPANDTITPLMALEARVELTSNSSKRTVHLRDFYMGVRKTVMQPDEMLTDIIFPSMSAGQRGIYIKQALRHAQAISLVNVTIILGFDEDEATIRSAIITFGSVAPTIIHAGEAEAHLTGKRLDEQVIKQASDLAANVVKPITDVRGSAEYRREMVKVIARRSMQKILNKQERENFPTRPILLKSHRGVSRPLHNSQFFHNLDTPIETTINGKRYSFKTGQNKTLLRLLREDAHLTGTKEGCAEGECGACTIYLDDAAVMSCMVPAPRAHGSYIVTVEGLAQDGKLHPVQETFIKEGAVQCGYCTPGFVMSAAKLLEEKPEPTLDEIKLAITGNLCRCTGYYKIIRAIELAAQGGI